MRREEHVDYFLIPDGQLAIHERLEAWARWVRVRPVGWQVAPMFRQYRADRGEALEERRSPRASICIPEAVEMEKAVSLLPEKHREAIRWCYYWSTLPSLLCKDQGKPWGPIAAARALGVTKQGLLDLVHSGRAILRNRTIVKRDGGTK